MSVICSIEALINQDGKNYKGTLDFYPSKCILHSSTKLITEFFYDINSAEFVSGTTKITFLDLYTKEKAYIQVKTAQGDSPLFIVEEQVVDSTLNTLRSSRTNSAKKNIKEIADYNRDAIAFFLNNPYCVLGIASNTSSSDANDALDKIKRLDRLGVISSYKPEYQLAGFSPISRDLAGCQSAWAAIKDIQHKWFWFDSVEACKNWQSETFRPSSSAGGDALLSYDALLAQYLYVLVFDAKFEHRNEWYKVFDGYQNIVGRKQTAVLRSKFSKSELIKQTDENIVSSFATHFFDPLNKLAEDAPIESLLGLFRSIRMDRHPAMKEYKRNLGGTIAQWVIKQEKTLWDKIEQYIGIGELSEDATEVVWQAAQEYERSMQSVFENILAALTMEPLRADMVKTSYKKVVEKLMVLLLAGGEKAKAAHYGTYLYKYSDNAAKLKIIVACGVDSIPGAREDFPELSQLIAGITEKASAPNPANKLVDSDEFEDITICEATSVLPRIDFCGLEFNGNSIGIKFWISNKTGFDLKLWIMDIEANGHYCGSTEEIGEVSDGDYDYYTYDLELPDEVDYYDLESLSFYVEVDRPGNRTIHDTTTVRVTCDTISETLSATY